MKFILLVLGLFIFSCEMANSQNCSLALKGRVIDAHDSSPLIFSTIFAEEVQKGDVADTAGYFIIKDLCPGEYHFTISHIGCEPEKVFIELQHDTNLIIKLEHHTAFLKTFEVEGSTHAGGIQHNQGLNSRDLKEMSGKTLSAMVEQLTGVQSIKNGTGIAKPVIHGLYGNRIGIVNNGILQEGQRWGNDHAPEVDPFTAKRITVLKGVDVLEYGGSGLGGLILIEPGIIGKDPHLHGDLTYKFQSNGRSHLSGLQLEKGGKLFNWRLTGSFQQSGDREAPAYYLTNTGAKSANFSVQLARDFNSGWKTEVYYSLFNSDIGILLGSQTSSVTDLLNAIERQEPFNTKPDFSYDIQAPRQEVQHHLAKAAVKKLLGEKAYFAYDYGFQMNDRKEYDIRRGDRSNKAALSLKMMSHFNKAYFFTTLGWKWSMKAGVQYQFKDNVNDPATGILPLIPDYQADRYGLYYKVDYRFKRGLLEFGSRIDAAVYEVDYISRSLPRTIISENKQFNTFSSIASIQNELKTYWTSNFSLGLVQRAPEVNELYSFGLHQGVSGIEEGNLRLSPETSLKGIWTHHLSLWPKLSLHSSWYYQSISDYIFLQIEPELRQTIRGAFPVYTYQQTNASIYGSDWDLNWQINEESQASMRYSMVRGKDESQNVPLVFIPADRLLINGSRLFKPGKKGKTLKLNAGIEYHWRQSRLNPDQDLIPPPKAYYLVQAGCSYAFFLSKHEMNLNVQLENLLNTSYRDYLNRLRYFSDEMGRSINIGVNYAF